MLADGLEGAADVGAFEADPPSADVEQRRRLLGGAGQHALVDGGIVDDQLPVEQGAGTEAAGALAGRRGGGGGADLGTAAGELLGDEHLDAGGAHVVEAFEDQGGPVDVDGRVDLEQRRPLVRRASPAARRPRPPPLAATAARPPRRRSPARSSRPRRRRRRCTSGTGRRRRRARGSPASRPPGRRAGRGVSGGRPRGGRRRAVRSAPARRVRRPAPARPPG